MILLLLVLFGLVPTCATGEVFSFCGTAAEPSCMNPDGVKIDGGQCIQGCFCDESNDYIRHEGECIQFLECPSNYFINYAIWSIFNCFSCIYSNGEV